MTDIIEVKALDKYQLHLKFEDGLEGIIDLKTIINFEGIFQPLLNYDYFSQVSVNPNTGTIKWANKADLDPGVLHSIVKKQTISNHHQS